MSATITPEVTVKHRLSLNGVVIGKYTEHELYEIRTAIDHTLEAHRRGVNYELITAIVCSITGYSWAEMESERRIAALAWARQVAMALTYERTNMSLNDVGKRFGGRDHGTVLHAIRTVQARRNTSDGKLVREVESALERQINQSAATTTANGVSSYAFGASLERATRP